MTARKARALGDFEEGPWDREDWLWVVLKSDTVRIIVNAGPKASWDWPKGSIISFGGDTNFKTPKGWFSFSRRGIDSSFSGFDKDDPNKMIRGQIKKAEDRIQDYQGAITVTIKDRSFTLTPKRLEEAKEQLKKRGVYTLAPGGMGAAFQADHPPP